MRNAKLLPAVVFSIYVLSSPFWIRRVSDVLRSAGILRAGLLTLTAALLTLFLREGYKRNPDLSWKRILPLAMTLSAYGFMLWPGRLKAWEEWIHFIHLGILAYLFDRALARPWVSALLAGVVGMAEEILQIWAPGRVFDWRDVGINTLAAFLAGALLRWR